MADDISSVSLEYRKAIGSAILEGLISPIGFRFTEGGDYDQGNGGYTQTGGGTHDQGDGDYTQTAAIGNDYLSAAQLGRVLKGTRG